MFAGLRSRGIRVSTHLRAGAGEGGGAPPAAPPATGQGTPPAAGLTDGEKTELETLRKKARDLEKAEADRLKAEKDKADKEAVERGEHAKVLEREKAARETAEKKAAEAELRAALVTSIAQQKLAEGALPDVVDVLVRQGAKLGADGKVEELDSKLAELKKTKPFYFAEGAAAQTGQQQSPARGLPGTPAAKGAAKDPWETYYKGAYAQSGPKN